MSFLLSERQNSTHSLAILEWLDTALVWRNCRLTSISSFISHVVDQLVAGDLSGVGYWANIYRNPELCNDPMVRHCTIDERMLLKNFGMNRWSGLTDIECWLPLLLLSDNRPHIESRIKQQAARRAELESSRKWKSSRSNFLLQTSSERLELERARAAEARWASQQAGAACFERIQIKLLLSSSL